VRVDDLQVEGRAPVRVVESLLLFEEIKGRASKV